MMTDQAMAVPARVSGVVSCPAGHDGSADVAVAYLLVVGAGPHAFVVRVFQQRRDAEQLCAAYAAEPWDDPAAGPRVVACPLNPVPSTAVVSPAALGVVATLAEQRAGLWELLKARTREVAGLRAELDAAEARAAELEQQYAAASTELFERTGVVR